MQLSPHAWPLLQTLQHAWLGDSGSAILTNVLLVNKLSDVHSEKVGADPATVPAPRAPRPRTRANTTNCVQRRILAIRPSLAPCPGRERVGSWLRGRLPQP